MFGDAIGSMIKFLFTLLLGDKDPTTGKMTNGIANGIAYNQLMFKSEWFSGSDIMNQMFSYFSIIGLGFAIIYFLLEINRRYGFEGNDITLKTFGAPFLKFVASLIVLMNYSKIVSWILGLHNAIISKVRNWTWAGNSLTTDVEATVQAINENVIGAMGLLALLVFLIPLIACLLVTLVCSFVWWYKAIGYKIEFLFRIGLSPIAAADIYGTGLSSGTMRWLKGLLAMTLYGMAFIIIPKIGLGLAVTDWNKAMTDLASGASSGAEQLDLLWTLIKNMVQLIVVPIAEIGVLGAARTATKEVLS